MNDHGSNPEEIVRYHISMFKRSFNSLRYRYDTSMPKQQNLEPDPIEVLQTFNVRVLIFYRKWIELRDHYLVESKQMEKAKYILDDNDNTAVKEHQKIIKEGLRSGEEYRLYYATRDEILTFFIDLLFLESMQCRVKNNFGVIQNINLERIKETLPSNNDEGLHVENCYSQKVKDFLAVNGLGLMGQVGVEDFKYYYYRSREKQDHKMDVKSLSEIERPLQIVWIKVVSEPNFLKAFRVNLEKRLLEEGTGKYVQDFNRMFWLYETFLIGSLVRMFVRDDGADILRAHLNDLKAVKFFSWDRWKFFISESVKALDEGEAIEDIAIPFLTTGYENYKDEDYKDTVAHIFATGGFRQVLFNRDDVLYVPGAFLIIPFQRDSFSSRIISKYNDDVEAIEKLDGLGGLTFSEEMEKFPSKNIRIC